MSLTKLNTGGGANRLRFEKFSNRLQKVNIDISHRKVHGALDMASTANPTTGEFGCHIQDELEQCRSLDVSSQFRLFYHKLWPLVQSLPELLHHQGTVVELLTKSIREVDVHALASLLRLVSVLARDLQEDLYKHFNPIFSSLASRINRATKQLSPEMIGKVFECMSYLIKYLVRQLKESPECLSPFYGSLLGHPKYFYRNLASKCFANLIRKLEIKGFRSHTKKLLKSLSANYGHVCGTSPAVIMGVLPCVIEDRSAPTPPIPRRMLDVIDGVSVLLFQSMKGVRGCLHSGGGKKLSATLELLTPLQREAVDAALAELLQLRANTEAAPSRKRLGRNKSNGIGEAASSVLTDKPLPSGTATSSSAAAFLADDGGSRSSINRQLKQLSPKSVAALSVLTSESLVQSMLIGRILSECCRRLFRHLHPSNSAELWLRLLSSVEGLVSAWRVNDCISDPPRHLQYHLIVTTSQLVEIVLFGMHHSNARALSDPVVRKSIAKSLIETTLGLCKVCFQAAQKLTDAGSDAIMAGDDESKQEIQSTNERGDVMLIRLQNLFCQLWLRFPSHPTLLKNVPNILDMIIDNMIAAAAADRRLGSSRQSGTLMLLSQKLLPDLPETIVRNYLVKPTLKAIVMLCDNTSPQLWLPTLLVVLTRIRDSRDDGLGESAALGGTIAGSGYEHKKDVGDNEEKICTSSHSEDEDEDDDSEEEHKRRKRNRLDDKKKKEGSCNSNEAPVVQRMTSAQGLLDHCSAELAAIASKCVDVVSETFSALVDRSTSTENQADGKGGKRRRGGSGENEGAPILTEEILAQACVATKSLEWLCIHHSAAFTLSKAVLDKHCHLVAQVATTFTSAPEDFHRFIDQSVIEREVGGKAQCNDRRNRKSESDAASLVHGTRALIVNLVHLIDAQRKTSFNSSGAPVLDAIAWARTALHNFVVLFCLSPYSISGSLSLLRVLRLALGHTNHKSAGDSKDDDGDHVDLAHGTGQLESTLQSEPFPVQNVLSVEDTDAVLMALGIALTTPSYWLRLTLIRIFSLLPKPVVSTSEQRAEPQTADRRDDVKTESKRKTKDNSQPKLPSDVRPKAANEPDVPVTVDVAELCLRAACTPSEIRTEREFARTLGSLEVIVRGGRGQLPPQYLRIVCAFCLGMLNVKFMPVWEPSIQVLVAAAALDEGEKMLWPLLMQVIHTFSYRGKSASNEVKMSRRNEAPVDDDGDDDDHNENEEDELQEGGKSAGIKTKTEMGNNNVDDDCDNDLMRSQMELCRLDSGVTNIDVMLSRSEVFYFNGSVADSRELMVRPDSRTDFDVAYANVWDVLKRCPQITLRRSRVVVPMFLRFLREQYYEIAEDDPDVPFLHRIGVLQLPSSIQSFTLLGGIESTHEESGGLESVDDFASLSHSEPLPPLGRSVLKKRLEMFLQVFAAVISPRQLYRHQMLFQYYNVLLVKPDTVVAKLALECILTYKPPHVMPYKDAFKRLLDEKMIRDEMVVFDLAPGATIDALQRPEIVPMIVRLAYGRFLSKARSNRLREKSLARRTAVLAFLSNLTQEELRHLVHMILRGLMPRQLVLTSTSQNTAADNPHQSLIAITDQWYCEIEQVLQRLQHDDMNEVVWERQVGCLYLLEQAVRVVGFGLTPYVGTLCKIVILLLTHAQSVRSEANRVNNKAHQESGEDAGPLDHQEEADIDDDEEIEAGFGDQDGQGDEETFVFSASIKNSNQSLRVRSMCLLRLAELVLQYHTVFPFERLQSDIFSPIMPLIACLPTSIVGCSRPPALLRLLFALMQHEQTVDMVALSSPVVEAIVRCVSSKAELVVMTIVIDILTILLERRDGEAIKPHVQLLIHCFSKRFAGADIQPHIGELRLSELKISPNGIKKELGLLCLVAEKLFVRSDVELDPTSTSSLATLLLGMVRTYTTSRKVRMEEDWAIHVLRIYKTLLDRMVDVRAHVPFVSRLFGPASHSQSLFNVNRVRSVLAEVYVALAEHASTASIMLCSARGMQEVTAMDPAVLDSRCFDRCMPVFAGLSTDPLAKARPSSRARTAVTEMSQRGSTSADSAWVWRWANVLGPQGGCDPRSSTLCTALVYECIRCLYDSELAIRVAALASLKRFIDDICDWSFGCSEDPSSLSDSHQALDSATTSLPPDGNWLDLLKSILIPSIRNGLRQSTDVVKRGFVSLLAHTVKYFGKRFNTSGQQEAIPGHDDDAFTRLLVDTFHADLLCLHHEDPDQDFFENITHLQIHRRIRALGKLRSLLKRTAPPSDFKDKAAEVTFTPTMSFEDGRENDDAKEAAIGDDDAGDDIESTRASLDGPVTALGISSLTHVLQPLALHTLIGDDFTKKDHLPLLQESAAFLGALALHLPWSRYMKLIKMLLKFLDRNRADREKVLLSALCAVLDAFHFDMRGDTEAEGLDDVTINVTKGEKPSTARAKKSDVSEGTGGGTGNLAQGRDGEDPIDEDVIEDVAVQGMESEGPLVPNTESEAEAENPETSALSQSAAKTHNIARTVVNSIMPWVRVFLLKEEEDHKGNKSKTVRPHVAVALTKLVCRLQAPVVPEQRKMGYFVNLVISVIGTLKSRDTSARDAARDSLSRMVLTMGMASLRSVIYEMQHMLTEGYQRHVCNYTIRALLIAALDGYTPPTATEAPSVPLDVGPRDAAGNYGDGNGDDDETKGMDASGVPIVRPDFDQCLPMIMQSVMDDLNGLTQTDFKVTEEGTVAKTNIRESKGSKANDILELCARSLLFRPTYALKSTEDPSSVSSVHAVASPLLASLVNSESSELIGRIGEALQRVALGLSKNPTVMATELLLYLHSTLHPFVVRIIKDLEKHRRAVGRIVESGKATDEQQQQHEDDDALLGDDLPSYLRDDSDDEEAALYSKQRKSDRGDNVTGFRASTWLPSERHALSDQRSVVEARNRERQERDRVLDGASAPKLTGSNRHKRVRESTGSNGGAADPAAVAAVRYCLNLFQSSLKNNRLDSKNDEIRGMVVPFLPLLGQCLRLEGAAHIVPVALRCLSAVLAWGLQVDPSFGRAVATRMLRLMFKGGALLSTDTDLVQACIKGMTSLFQAHARNIEVAKSKAIMQVETEIADDDDNGDASKVKTFSSISSKAAQRAIMSSDGAPVVPLRQENLRALLQLLTTSVMTVTANFQTAVFQLIRVMVDARVMLPEMYDLIDKLVEQIVLSHRKGVREAATGVVVAFLLGYPLGDKRFVGHLTQLLANCAYEFEEGRASAIDALNTLARLLPEPLVDKNAQLLFLPMTLRVVNDPSGPCRAAATEVLSTLAKRVRHETFGMLADFSFKWLKRDVRCEQDRTMLAQEMALLRTGSQVVSIFVGSRPDLMKKGGRVRLAVGCVGRALNALVPLSADFSLEGGDTDGPPDASSRRRRQKLADMSTMEEAEGAAGTEEWAIVYYLLLLLEALFNHLPSSTDRACCQTIESSTEGKKENGDDNEGHLPDEGHEKEGCLLMLSVFEAIVFPHSWVRAAASRVLKFYVSRRDVTLSQQQQRVRLSTSSQVSGSGDDSAEALLCPNALYQLGRRLCVALNQPLLAPAHLDALVTDIVFVVRTMARNPHLALVRPTADNDEDGDDCQGDIEGVRPNDHDRDEDGDEVDIDNEDDGEDENGDEGDDDLDGGSDDECEPKSFVSPLDGAVVGERVNVDGEKETAASGANWMMQRLRGIGADPRGRRRIYVIQVYSELVKVEDEDFAFQHMKQMVEVALRSRLLETGPDEAILRDTKEAAAALLEAVELKVGSTDFIGAFSQVQRSLQGRKVAKKKAAAAEAIYNPRAFALKKIAKTQKKMESKKRKKALKLKAIKGLRKRP